MIFDTDLGNDVDDAMALAVVHALQNRCECELLAVTLTKDNPYAAPMADILNVFYGRGEIPVGVPGSKVTPEDGNYNRRVYESGRYPVRIRPETKLPNAVTLLRRILAAQDDDSVVFVQIGFSTNLARLLDTPADDISPLTGKELIEKKIRLLSVMAGIFHEKYKHVEYNIECDLASARKLFAEYPGEIVFSGFEVGDFIHQESAAMKNDFGYVKHHPVKDAYEYYRGLDNSQPTFDLNSVLYAVRPDRGYYGVSERGTVVLDENGRTSFAPGPEGKHRYQTVTPEQIAKVREILALLISEPPQR